VSASPVTELIEPTQLPLGGFEVRLELALCQTFVCQTFARLLKASCRYERPKMFQPGRNPRLFACLWQKLEEEDRLPIDYESHALTI
jgi:hypothetical protein